MMRKISLPLTLLIFALAAASCNPSSAATDTPTAEPKPSKATATLVPATPEATPTPTPFPLLPGFDSAGNPIIPTVPVVIDPAAAIPHLSEGKDVLITNIDMQTKTTGWALGGERDPGDHVLRTTDGGETWLDVTPPEPAPTGGDSNKIAHAFFMDADNAWVTYSSEDFFNTPENTLVWYTQDGGATWQHSPYLETRGFMEFYYPEFLQFSDAQNGWLLVAVGAGMSHSYSLLFQTSDGGATWERIIDPQSSPDLHTCCKTGMVFLDSLTGIVTSEQGPYTAPFVTWTRDGGLTWETQILPEPTNYPDLFENAYCETHSPNINSINNPYSNKYEPYVRLGVSCRQYDDDGNVTYIHFMYTTMNGGESWSSFKYPGGVILIYGIDFIMALERNIYKLSMNPLGWILIKTVNWDGQFSFVLREYDYSGVQYGWAVARNGDEIAFLTTSDGGETWQEINPRIVEID